MNTTKEYTDAMKVLKSVNQAHVLRHFKILNETEKLDLLKKLKKYNGQEIQKQYKSADDYTAKYMTKIILNPYSGKNLYDAQSFKHEILLKFSKSGLRAIAAGEVGVLLLGDDEECTNGPLGILKPGLLSRKCIFELNAERIRKIQELSGSYPGNHIIKWYIAINENTKTNITDNFKNNSYYGLESKNVIFFEQRTLPCFDTRGKFILQGKSNLVTRSEGSGGILDALVTGKVLDHMRLNGVQFIFMYTIDNLLCKVADPVFMGFCIDKDMDCAAKMVRKEMPYETNPIICSDNGRTIVLPQYMIGTDRLAEMFDKQNFLFDCLSIGTYMVTVDYLDKCSHNPKTLHSKLVKRKSHVIDNTLDIVSNPSGHVTYSLEKDIYDIFQYTTAFCVWEVSRRNEYSKVNIADTDGKMVSQMAIRDLYQLHKHWVDMAHGNIATDDIEISPLLSYAGEGLKDLVDGKFFGNSIYLEPSLFVKSQEEPPPVKKPTTTPAEDEEIKKEKSKIGTSLKKKKSSKSKESVAQLDASSFISTVPTEVSVTSIRKKSLKKNRSKKITDNTNDYSPGKDE